MNNLVLFLIFLSSSLIIFLLSNLFDFVCLFVKKGFFRVVLDILICIISACIFLILVNLLNFGEIRGFLLVAFILGLFLLKKILGNLFAKLNAIVYNSIIKSKQKFKGSKLSKVLFR